MNNERAKDIIRGFLSPAGIAINGNKPWDIQVRNDAFYSRLLAGGSLAAGESYMDGWWDVDKLDEFFCRLLKANLYDKLALNLPAKLAALYARLVNRQTVRRAHKVAETHYNLGNDFYRAMLGKRMTYTCAYWKNARNLDDAEEAKLELVCRKLQLKPGMSVVEFGCGWGSFAKYAAENYGVKVLGVNIAEEQVKLGRELCRGLPVELRVQDYREVQGQFDRVVSIGIMEHVGPKNYVTYMKEAARCLRDDGIAFIHTICQNTTDYHCDPWFDRYIFPNAVTPSMQLLSAAMEGHFVMEDCHNIGPHYDPTLIAWYDNLTRAWPTLKDKYGERFYRMMKYYLLSSAGCFRSRSSQVVQIVMTKPGKVQPDCRMNVRPGGQKPAREEPVLERR